MLKAVRPDGIEPRVDEPVDAGPTADAPLAELEADDPEQYRATLVEHLNELRQRIVRSLLILIGGWVIGWIVQPWLYRELNEMIFANLRAVAGPEVQLEEAFRNAADPFMLKIKLSFMLGLGLAMPFIVLQIWGFVRPGLRLQERKPIERVAPLSVVLFALGAFTCYLILPAAIQWFASFLEEFPNTGLIQEPGSMVFFVIRMMLAFGIGFQLPLVVYALGAIGLLSSATLTKYWRQSAIVIFLLSAVLTPSGDPLSMTVMAVPLVILFFVSVWAVKVTQRKKQANAATD